MLRTERRESVSLGVGKGNFEMGRLDKHKAIRLIGQHLFCLLLMVLLFGCEKKAGESEVEGGFHF